MKVANSLKSLKKRDAACKVVKRKGRVYVINKKNPATRRVRAKISFVVAKNLKLPTALSGRREFLVVL